MTARKSLSMPQRGTVYALLLVSLWLLAAHFGPFGYCLVDDGAYPCIASRTETNLWELSPWLITLLAITAGEAGSVLRRRRRHDALLPMWSACR